MNVGNYKPGIQISKNIFEDSYSQPIVFIGHNKNKINNFVTQNLFKANNNTIVFDMLGNFRNKQITNENITVIDFNNKAIHYDPFSDIHTDYDITTLSNYILSCYKFKTRHDPKLFSSALFSFLNATIGFCHTNEKDASTAAKVLEFAELFLKNENETTKYDTIFLDYVNKNLVMNFNIKYYIKFKTFNQAMQQEAAIQCIAAIKDIAEKPYIKNSSLKNSILIDESFFDKNYVIIPKLDENKLLFNITTYIFDKISNIRILSENKYKQNRINFLLAKAEQNNWQSFFEELQFETIKRTQVIITGFDTVLYNKYTLAMLKSSYATYSITFICNSIKGATSLLKEYITEDAIFILSDVVQDDIKTIENLYNKEIKYKPQINEFIVLPPGVKEAVIDFIPDEDFSENIKEQISENHLQITKTKKRNTNFDNLLS